MNDPEKLWRSKRFVVLQPSRQFEIFLEDVFGTGLLRWSSPRRDFPGPASCVLTVFEEALMYPLGLSFFVQLPLFLNVDFCSIHSFQILSCYIFYFSFFFRIGRPVPASGVPQSIFWKIDI